MRKAVRVESNRNAIRLVVPLVGLMSSTIKQCTGKIFCKIFKRYEKKNLTNIIGSCNSESCTFILTNCNSKKFGAIGIAITTDQHF